jgi:hypothetical protein
MASKNTNKKLIQLLQKNGISLIYGYDEYPVAMAFYKDISNKIIQLHIETIKKISRKDWENFKIKNTEQ